jgi:hypothetical protein
MSEENPAREHVPSQASTEPAPIAEDPQTEAKTAKNAESLWQRDVTTVGKKESWWNRPVCGSGTNKEPRRRWQLRDTIGLLIIFAIFDLISGMGALHVFWMLVFGWVGFVQRIAPEWRSSQGAVVSGVLVGLAFLLCLHGTCRWWRRHKGQPWGLASTLRLGLALVLTFVGGVAALGVVHQAAWCFRDGLYENSQRFVMRSKIQAFLRQTEDPASTKASLEAALFQLFPKEECFLGQRDDGSYVVMVRERKAKAELWVGETRLPSSTDKDRSPRVYPMPGSIADNMHWLTEALVLPAR